MRELKQQKRALEAKKIPKMIQVRKQLLRKNQVKKLMLNLLLRKMIANLLPRKMIANLLPRKMIANLLPRKMIANLQPRKWIAKSPSRKLQASNLRAHQQAKTHLIMKVQRSRTKAKIPLIMSQI